MNKGNERIGLKNTNKQGYEMEIIDYKDNKHITVLFPQFNYTKITSYSYFKNGIPIVPNKVLYIGKIFTTNFGTDFTVIDYINDSYVLIKFNDEYGFEKVVELGNIKAVKLKTKIMNMKKKEKNMKITNKNKIDLLPIENYESGTVVDYGSRAEMYGYGIILKNDLEHCIIYDIEDKTYYSDYENYYVYKVYNDVELVLND